MEVIDAASALSGPFGLCRIVGTRSTKGWGLARPIHTTSATIGSVSGLMVRSGEVSPAFTPLRFDPRLFGMLASGRATDAQIAEAVAVMESAERYAPFVYDESKFVSASATELGASAIDLDSLPRMSPTELEQGRGSMVNPDKGTPIRWVQASSLVDNSSLMVPAVIPFVLRMPYSSERFWIFISTGQAAHFDPWQAVLSGLCEMIERDAVALTWLQRLALNEIEPDCLGDDVISLIEFNRRQYIETHLFDATMELSIPTIYCLLVSPNSDRAAQVVAACTAPNASDAAVHAITEAVTVTSSIRHHKEPDDPRLFGSLLDGAAYMGRPEHRHAFEFLLSAGEERRTVSEVQSLPLPEEACKAVEVLVRRMAERGMHPVLVDIASDECKALGVSVVHAFVPELQPFSFVPNAQYRQHQRLYDGPRANGFVAALDERDLNPWPQPFA